MTAQRGRDLLVKLDASGGGSFTTVAGLRTRSLAFNARSVDITNADSSGQWRELLAGAGVRSASVSGRGIFRDEASDASVRETFFDAAIRNWQVVIPDFGTVAGAFQITALEFAGEHDGEVTFDLSLESAGELVFTAL
jgi:TP901-1 family phage major tail protein